MSAMAVSTSSRPSICPEGGRSRRGVRVQVNNVVKEYPAAGTAFTRAIGPASLNVNPGEFVVVVGPSGCGKTTLLKLLAGMITPTAGMINMGDDGNGTRVRTGMVFQAASLYPWRRLVDNVSFGLELRANNRLKPMSKADIKERAGSLLHLVGLKGFETFYPHQVSGGMQQRVNLARALAIDPSLLLMDEPFSALDAQTREELQLELQRIAVEAAPTTLFVTHDIREAVFLGDRIVVLSKHPGTVTAEIDVPTPRPRPLGYQVSQEFGGIMREIWQLVHPGARVE